MIVAIPISCPIEAFSFLPAMLGGLMFGRGTARGLLLCWTSFSTQNGFWGPSGAGCGGGRGGEEESWQQVAPSGQGSVQRCVLPRCLPDPQLGPLAAEALLEELPSLLLAFKAHDPGLYAPLVGVTVPCGWPSCCRPWDSSFSGIHIWSLLEPSCRETAGTTASLLSGFLEAPSLTPLKAGKR